MAQQALTASPRDSPDGGQSATTSASSSSPSSSSKSSKSTKSSSSPTSSSNDNIVVDKSSGAVAAAKPDESSSSSSSAQSSVQQQQQRHHRRTDRRTPRSQHYSEWRRQQQQRQQSAAGWYYVSGCGCGSCAAFAAARATASSTWHAGSTGPEQSGHPQLVGGRTSDSDAFPRSGDAQRALGAATASRATAASRVGGDNVVGADPGWPKSWGGSTALPMGSSPWGPQTSPRVFDGRTLPMGIVGVPMGRGPHGEVVHSGRVSGPNFFAKIALIDVKITSKNRTTAALVPCGSVAPRYLSF